MLRFPPPTPLEPGDPLAVAERRPSVAPGAEVGDDHLDPAVRYLATGSPALVRRDDGHGELLLLRFASDYSLATGGMLMVRLELPGPTAEAIEEAAEGGRALRTVPYDAARIRLRVGSPTHDPVVGSWHEVPARAGELFVPWVALDEFEAEILGPLLEDLDAIVGAEVELRYRGLASGPAWLAAGDVELLRGELRDSLADDGPWRADQVVAAFLSLPDGDGADAILELTPLEHQPAAVSPSLLRAEAGMQALARLFEPVPTDDPWSEQLYRWSAPTDQVRFAWDLRTPRHEPRVQRLDWSLAELGELDEEARRRYFPVVTAAGPFEAVEVHVICQLPFHKRGLRKLMATVRFPGPGGVPQTESFAFDGSHKTASVLAVHPAGADFVVEHQLSGTTAPPAGRGWSVPFQREFVSNDGPVVRIGPAAVGMDFVEVAVDPAVFDQVAAIEVRLVDGVLFDPPAEEAPPIEEVPPIEEPVAASAEVVDEAPADSPADPVPEEPDASEPDPPEDPPLAVSTFDAAVPCASLALRRDAALPLGARVFAHRPESEEPELVEIWSGRLDDRVLELGRSHVELIEPDRIEFLLHPDSAELVLALVEVEAAGGIPSQTFTLRVDEPAVRLQWRESLWQAPSCRARPGWLQASTGGGGSDLVWGEWTEMIGTRHLLTLPVEPADPTEEPG